MDIMITNEEGNCVCRTARYGDFMLGSCIFIKERMVAVHKTYGLINGRIIQEDAILKDKILIFKDKVLGMVDIEEMKKYPNVQWIDVEGMYISPGFIDIHIHGFGGCDTMDGTLDAIKTISNTVAETGVTGFLPTTMTMDKDRIYKAFDAVRQAMGTKMPGAKVLGCHMEGPFISEKYKGAQNPQYVIKPDYDLVKVYMDVIKIITIAPERDKGYSFISKMHQHEDVVLSIGHSSGTYEESMEAIQKGIRHVTHLFNAMTPMHHREPGVVGTALRSRVTCELIADKLHVHPAIFQLLVDVKGKEHLVLVTDSTRAGGMGDGVYDLGGQKVIVKDDFAKLANGTLAGSVLTLNKAVKNIFENTNLAIYEAVKLASLNPAKVIKIDDRKGSLKIGKDADITVFNKDFHIYLTVVEGNIVFNNFTLPQRRS